MIPNYDKIESNRMIFISSIRDFPHDCGGVTAKWWGSFLSVSAGELIGSDLSVSALVEDCRGEGLEYNA